MDKEELKKILNEKGMDWLIAAMVEGSIGYHSPENARRLIESALTGKTKDWCERCLACFKGDLLQMIDYFNKVAWLKSSIFKSLKNFTSI